MRYLFCGQTPSARASAGDDSPADMAQQLCAPWVALARSGAQAPFDACRTVHAAAVQGGLAQPSLLASAAFERRLVTLERLALGPWARAR